MSLVLLLVHRSGGPDPAGLDGQVMQAVDAASRGGKFLPLVFPDGVQLVEWNAALQPFRTLVKRLEALHQAQPGDFDFYAVLQDRQGHHVEDSAAYTRRFPVADGRGPRALLERVAVPGAAPSPQGEEAIATLFDRAGGHHERTPRRRAAPRARTGSPRRRGAAGRPKPAGGGRRGRGGRGR